MRLNWCEVAKLLLLKIRFSQFFFFSIAATQWKYRKILPECLCGSSITSKQTGGKKSCFIRVASSVFVSFFLPLDYLHHLFVSFSAIASAHMLLLLLPLLLRVHAPSASVHVAPDLGFMPVSVVWVWFLDTAGERARETERGQGHYIMLTLLARCPNIMKGHSVGTHLPSKKLIHWMNWNEFWC